MNYLIDKRKPGNNLGLVNEKLDKNKDAEYAFDKKDAGPKTTTPKKMNGIPLMAPARLVKM